MKGVTATEMGKLGASDLQWLIRERRRRDEQISEQAEAEGLAMMEIPKNKYPKKKPSSRPGYTRFKVKYHM